MAVNDSPSIRSAVCLMVRAVTLAFNDSPSILSTVCLMVAAVTPFVHRLPRHVSLAVSVCHWLQDSEVCFPCSPQNFLTCEILKCRN